jgi:hypothetical protein
MKKVRMCRPVEGGVTFIFFEDYPAPSCRESSICPDLYLIGK